MQETIFNELRDLVCDRLDIPKEDFTDEASFIEDLDADSLDIVDLAMHVEERFGITIPQDDYAHFATVASAVAYIVARTSTQPAQSETTATSAPT
jgi:acyl carrier protein